MTRRSPVAAPEPLIRHYAASTLDVTDLARFQRLAVAVCCCTGYHLR